MSALRRILRGMLVVAVAAGFTLFPAAPAEASAAAPSELACPLRAGWYLLYDENDELVGVMYVDEDCKATTWF